MKKEKMYDENSYSKKSKLEATIEEAKRLEANPKAKRYTDMDEMWADLGR